MQLGADGNLWLASVRRANPLTPTPTPAPAVVTTSIAPAVCEYDETISTGPTAVSNEPADDCWH